MEIKCFTDSLDLNKVCPKDEFPLPNIDLLADATGGHSVLFFIVDFSGYNQIKMDLLMLRRLLFRHLWLTFTIQSCCLVSRMQVPPTNVLRLPFSTTCSTTALKIMFMILFWSLKNLTYKLSEKVFWDADNITSEWIPWNTRLVLLLVSFWVSLLPKVYWPWSSHG